MSDYHLLTHNHFQLLLHDLMADAENRELAKVTLNAVDGRQLWQGTLAAVEIAYEDAESLLLRCQHEFGSGLFETLSLPTASVAPLLNGSSQVGQKVAQINWARKQAFVQWTQITEITTVNGHPVIRLDECIVLGASGGGIFLDGSHIANNWSRVYTCDQVGADAHQYGSTAVLNNHNLTAGLN